MKILKRFDKEIWATVNFESIQKRSRILVIDDDGFPYEGLFKKENYTIIIWKSVESINELENEQYDVILLDINGIGKDYSSSEGLGILEHLKKTNPLQMVIAMTNKTWGVDATTFFSLADDRLNKTEDFIIYKEKIDILLKKRFSKEYYLDKLNFELKNLGYNEKTIKNLFEKSIITKNIDRFTSKIKDIDDEKIKTIKKILSAAVSIFTTVQQFM